MNNLPDYVSISKEIYCVQIIQMTHWSIHWSTTQPTGCKIS